MKSIKYFIRFIKETKEYKKESIIHQILHNKLLKKAIWYSKAMRLTDKMIKHYNKSIQVIN